MNEDMNNDQINQSDSDSNQQIVEPIVIEQANQTTVNQVTTNGKSIAGMVLGILSIVSPYVGLILGIIGIVLSKKALDEIKISNEQGKGMAVAGLVTSIVGVSIYALIILLVSLVGGILFVAH